MHTKEHCRYNNTFLKKQPQYPQEGNIVHGNLTKDEVISSDNYNYNQVTWSVNKNSLRIFVRFYKFCLLRPE